MFDRSYKKKTAVSVVEQLIVQIVFDCHVFLACDCLTVLVLEKSDI